MCPHTNMYVYNTSKNLATISLLFRDDYINIPDQELMQIDVCRWVL